MPLRLYNHPVLCNYYLTYRCNAKCGFCDIWEKPSPYVDAASHTANLRDLKRLGVRVIDYTGGEPLLHRGLPEFLAQARSMGFITTVTTNCLLYPKYAAQLRGLVDMLHFSLDHPDRDAHNASRGVACYNHLLDSICIAKELGERPDILFTVTEDSWPLMERVYREICQPNGLLLILNPVFAYNAVGTNLLPAAALAEMRRIARLPQVYLNDAFLTLRENGGNQISDPVCVAASSTVVISPEDKLVLPCYHLGMEELPIEGQLYQLWHTPQVAGLRALEGRLPQCQGCTINCYMQPSFAYQLNKYFWQALPGTLKYMAEKWVYG